ncbi:DoxX family protein [Stenotrophomonas sp. ATs4]|uniref:DoxX family protein n=1 Tax=Stenotrophomonas sp. ATs4 TaxID=3402766 RepID=UPI003F7101CD
MPHSPSPITSSAALLGRLLLSAIFLVSGIGKLADASGTIGYIASSGLPLPQLAYVAALAVELGGALLLVLGYQTRSVALLMALFALATAIGFHANVSDQNQLFHFLKNLAMAGGLLQVCAFGAGAFSLDAKRNAGAAS